MSLVDEVLAEHAKARLGDYCSVCHDQWICESVRLALSLRAADIAIESLKLHKPGYCKACNEAAVEGHSRRDGSDL